MNNNRLIQEQEPVIELLAQEYNEIKDILKYKLMIKNRTNNANETDVKFCLTVDKQNKEEFE